MKSWAWLWWVLGLGAAGTAAYFVFRPSTARALAGPVSCGPCMLPANGGFTEADAQALCALVNQGVNAPQTNTCHHDIVEAINYYAAHHAADGSVTFVKDGASHTFLNFAAFLAAAAAG